MSDTIAIDGKVSAADIQLEMSGVDEVEDLNLVSEIDVDAKSLVVEDVNISRSSIPLVSIIASSLDIEQSEVVDTDLASVNVTETADNDVADEVDGESIVVDVEATQDDGEEVEEKGEDFSLQEEVGQEEDSSLHREDDEEEEDTKNVDTLEETTGEELLEITEDGELEEVGDGDANQSIQEMLPHDKSGARQSTLTEPDHAVGFLFDDNSSSKFDSVSRYDTVSSRYDTVTLDIDREDWTNRYKQALVERVNHQRKNVILQRILQRHYKARKVLNVFTASEQITPEMQRKYDKKLRTYDEIRTLVDASRQEAESNLAEFKAEEETLAATAAMEMESLMDLEREMAKGMIDFKTGKHLHPSVVERYIRHQTYNADELNRYRLAYIKLQDQTNEMAATMSSLEVIGDDLNMLDYEQLVVENQNLSDKVEERQDELNKLKSELRRSIQIIAHYREKSFAILETIQSRKVVLLEDKELLTEARNNVTMHKQQLVKLREEYVRETEQAGLLAKPVLIRDFETTLDLLAKMKEEIQNLRNTCADEHHQLLDIRNAIQRNHDDYETSRIDMQAKRKAALVKFGLSKNISKIST